jgi:hypothetical protein
MNEQNGNKPIGFLVILLAIILVININTAVAAEWALHSDSDIAKIVWAEGETIGYPETLLAIATIETKLGSYKKTDYGIVGDTYAVFGDRSYGLCQVKLQTARFVLRTHPELGTFKTDEHLLVALITDNEFNAKVGARYYQMMLNRFGSWRQALIAYNAGPANAEKWRDPLNYADRALKVIKRNRDNGTVTKQQ